MTKLNKLTNLYFAITSESGVQDGNDPSEECFLFAQGRLRVDVCKRRICLCHYMHEWLSSLLLASVHKGSTITVVDGGSLHCSCSKDITMYPVCRVAYTYTHATCIWTHSLQVFYEDHTEYIIHTNYYGSNLPWITQTNYYGSNLPWVNTNKLFNRCTDIERSLFAIQEQFGFTNKIDFKLNTWVCKYIIWRRSS